MVKPAAVQHSSAQILAAQVLEVAARVMLDLAAVDGAGLRWGDQDRGGQERQGQKLSGKAHRVSLTDLLDERARHAAPGLPTNCPQTPPKTSASRRSYSRNHELTLALGALLDLSGARGRRFESCQAP